MNERQQPTVSVVIDGRVTAARSMMEGIMLRGNVMSIDDVEYDGQMWTGRSLVEMARDCLERCGINVKQLTDKRDLVQRAMRGPAISSSDLAAFARGELVGGGTSDFTYILAATANKVLIDGYKTAPVTWRKWCKKGMLSDFKSADRIQFTDFGGLKEVKELGQYEGGFMSDKRKPSSWLNMGANMG